MVTNHVNMPISHQKHAQKVFPCHSRQVGDCGAWGWDAMHATIPCLLSIHSGRINSSSLTLFIVDNRGDYELNITKPADTMLLALDPDTSPH